MKPSVLEVRRVEALEKAADRLDEIEQKIADMSAKIDLLAGILERLVKNGKLASKPVTQNKGEE